MRWKKSEAVKAMKMIERTIEYMYPINSKNCSMQHAMRGPEFREHRAAIDAERKLQEARDILKDIADSKSRKGNKPSE